MKTFKYFKIPANDDALPQPGAVHKYSIYMQSRDARWLNRNIHSGMSDEEPEPIEEDIRD